MGKSAHLLARGKSSTKVTSDENEQKPRRLLRKKTFHFKRPCLPVATERASVKRANRQEFSGRWVSSFRGTKYTNWASAEPRSSMQAARIWIALLANALGRMDGKRTRGNLNGSLSLLRKQRGRNAFSRQRMSWAGNTRCIIIYLKNTAKFHHYLRLHTG